MLKIREIKERLLITRKLGLEEKIAKAVTIHAIPVESGTVARTKMISVEERASRAVIAWMRHKPTAYNSMNIPRIKGKRREVRRMLAGMSAELLSAYRKGITTSDDCPLKKYLQHPRTPSMNAVHDVYN